MLYYLWMSEYLWDSDWAQRSFTCTCLSQGRRRWRRTEGQIHSSVITADL